MYSSFPRQTPAGAGRRDGVAALLARRAAETPSTVAFVEGASGATLTWGQVAVTASAWGELVAAAEIGVGQMAGEVGAAGRVGPGQTGQFGRGARFGLLVSDPLTMVSAYLSGLSAGVALAPLNPAGTSSERRRQMATLGLAGVITDDPAADCAQLPRWLLGAAGPTLGTVAATPARAPAEPGASIAAPAGDAAVILASSGTTGTPKIIPLTEAQLLHTARALVDHHQIDAEARGYCPLPLFHINALVVGVLATVVAGSTLVVDRRFSARSFWSVVARHQATWLNLVPAIIGVLARGDPPPEDVAARIGFARSASAPLPAATRERFERRTGIGVLETYGMTEAASQIAANPRTAAERRPGSVGRPVGLDARVVNRQGAVLPAGEVGQVEIRGASVIDHYWAPQAGVSPGELLATRDGWLATGDLGRQDADGYLFLVGRVDDVINRGGEKVFPRDVEEVLLRDEDVTAAAVVGRPHPMVGHEPVAFVLARAGADRDVLGRRLALLCDRELSRFRRPVDITVADTLPAGPTGKIRHAQLRRELAHYRQKAGYEEVADAREVAYPEEARRI